MNKRIQFILIFGITLSFFSGFSNASEIEDPSVLKIEGSSLFAPSDLVKIPLFHNEDEFHVVKDYAKHEVKNYLLSRSLRNIAKDSLKLEKFLQNDYTDVNQAKNNDEYLLEIRGRLQGGLEEIEDPSVTPGKIEKTSVFVHSDLGKIVLFHDEEGFHILKNGKKHQVKNHFLDRLLRNISQSSSKLKKFLKNGYISVNQAESGEYLLEARSRLKGGGIWGATIGAYAGKFFVSFVGHGAIVVVSGLTGPAAPATFAALEATFGAAIEVASTAAAVGCGIVGAVATGPV